MDIAVRHANLRRAYRELCHTERGLVQHLESIYYVANSSEDSGAAIGNVRLAVNRAMEWWAKQSHSEAQTAVQAEDAATVGRAAP